VAAEGRGERVWRLIASASSDLVQRGPAGEEEVARQGHAPIGQILHRCLAEDSRKDPRERGAAHAADRSQLGHRPLMGRVVVDGFQRSLQARVPQRVVPARRGVALPKSGADRQNQDHVKEPVEDDLLTGGVGTQFVGKRRDRVVQRIPGRRLQDEDLCSDSMRAGVTSPTNW